MGTPWTLEEISLLWQGSLNIQFDYVGQIWGRPGPLWRHHYCDKGPLIYHFIASGRYGDILNPWGDIITVARAS